MAEKVRVELPERVTCPGCGQVVPPPYRGKPLELAGTELLVWCTTNCRIAHGTEGLRAR